MKATHIVYGLLVFIGIFHAATLRSGHDWGDDFSMSILFGRNRFLKKALLRSPARFGAASQRLVGELGKQMLLQEGVAGAGFEVAFEIVSKSRITEGFRRCLIGTASEKPLLRRHLLRSPIAKADGAKEKGALADALRTYFERSGLSESIA